MSRSAGTRTGRGRDDVPGRVRAVLRPLVAVAVLTGFVAMHGMSADHDLHAWTGLSGGHHAASPVVAGGHDTEVAPATAPTGVVTAWELPGRGHGTHPDDGCLVMLAFSVMALVLAAVAGRRTGLPATQMLLRAGDLRTPRGPPRRTAPCLFALGVLRR